MRALRTWRTSGVAVAVAAGVVVFVSGGCGRGGADDIGDGAEDDDVTTSVPVTTAAPTTTTTPPPLSLEDSAARYLVIVEPYDLALEGLEQAVNNGEPVETLRARADATATANATHVEELRSTRWPADVQPAVDQLIVDAEAAQPFWQEAAQATTLQAVIDAAVAAGEHDGGEAAGIIRSRLHLDEYDEDDYNP